MSEVSEDEIYNSFVQVHGGQLRASGVPAHFYKALCTKLYRQIFDSGHYFILLMLDYEDDGRGTKDPVFTVMANKEMRADDGDAIFLVDHAITFKQDNLRKQLIESPSIVKRLNIMMGLPETSDDVELIMDNVWRFSNFYSINAQGGAVEDSLPLWYIMDELGSGIRHSDEPNFRCVPFIFAGDQMTYNLLFPIENVEKDEYVTRDYIEGIPEDRRELMMLPWEDTDFTDNSYVQQEPEESYFLHGRIEESLAKGDGHAPKIDSNRPLKVFSDYEFVNKYLTDPSFEVLGSDGKSEDADILWFTKHFKGFSELSLNFPNTFVNQFPFENVITIKDLLAVVSRRTKDGGNPDWLPITYNLRTELKEFVSYFQTRKEQGLDNHFIIKPFNLARSLDMSITENLDQIIRLAQTGPKIVQKYIETPVLFDRDDANGKVKFDVRYVILVTGVNPLSAHVYKNFFLRFSNVPFAMNEFDVYEKHFTVMNYGENLNLKHLKCAEFLKEWKLQYENHRWEKIEEKICEMMKEMLTGATMKKPPCGIGKNLQSRGLYAADIILSWNDDGEIQPKLLEVNFIPDCKRACEYYPDFYNDIFKLLFLGQENDEVFQRIA